MELHQFQQHILQGIPAILPEVKPYEKEINHAPKRKDILNNEEKSWLLKTLYVILMPTNTLF